MPHAAALALIVLMFTAPCVAQVHRCTGPDGKTIYSDAPCTGAGGQVRLTDNAAGAVKAPPGDQTPADARQPSRTATTKPACPGDLEIRNLETAASSTTVSKAERERRVAQWRAAELCRSRGTAYADELDTILRQSERQQRSAADDRMAAARRAAAAQAAAEAEAAAKQGRPERDAIQSCSLGICRGADGEQYRPAPGMPDTFTRSDGRTCKTLVPGMNTVECR